MSIRPEWVKLILTGYKTKEVRKRAPLIRHPYKVYIYCTKGGDPIHRVGKNGKPYLMNGTVCGEFICTSTVEDTPPWRASPGGTFLTARQLYEYGKDAQKLCFMTINDPVLYEEPKYLKDFGQKTAPQSWRYIEVEEPNEVKRSDQD